VPGVSEREWRPVYRIDQYIKSQPPCRIGLFLYNLPVNAGEEILDFLVGQIPAQSLADFQISNGARERVWALIAKEKDSGLLPEEKVELEDYLRLEHLVVLAKAKALMARHG
jgi:hypothetical protein